MAPHAAHVPAQPNVVTWRARRLRAAGFDKALARRLAADARYDIHALVDLAERGCPPQVAVRILAPLEDREQAP